MDRQKIIPTFINKNSVFISFSDNGRDNEKVGITILAILVLLIRFYVFIKDLIKSCWLDYLLWGIIRFNNRMR